MDEKKFYGKTLPEVYEQVKSEFGRDGIIISQREVKKGFGFGLFGEKMIEVIAKPPAKNSSYSSALSSPPPLGTMGAAGGAEQALLEQVQEMLDEQRRAIVESDKRNKAEIQDMFSEMYKDRQHQQNDQSFIRAIPYELAEMKRKVDSLLSGQDSLGDEVHANLASLYQSMVYNGVSRKFAKRIVQEAQKQIPPSKRDDYNYVKLFVAHLFMPVIGLAEFPTSYPVRQCFIGPTGVGKTTTIAKIASLLRKEDEDRKIALVTTDTFRIGAKAQLEEYARRIKVPFKSADSSSTLRIVLDDLKKYDVILIDTPGVSQKDEHKLAHLKEMLLSQDDIYFHLVLAANQRDEVSEEVTKRYGTFRLHSMLYTKIDETSVYGGIYNHAIRFKIPLLGLATGQNVPDDFEPPSRERLIDLLMNLSSLTMEKP